jgi:hypothetical protein
MDRAFDTYGELLPVLQAWLTACRAEAGRDLRRRLPAVHPGPRPRRASRPPCRPGRSPTSASTARGSPTSCSCCGCGPIPARGAQLRRDDADRAAKGGPLVPHPRRAPRSGWRLVGVPAGASRLHDRSHRRALRRRRSRVRGGGGVERRSRRLRPRRRDKGARRDVLRLHRLSEAEIEPPKSSQWTPPVAPRLFHAYVGDRDNRRHRPGRAFERTSYRFDIVSDYGAFRDLQRHRMLTIEWQPLSTDARLHRSRDRRRSRSRRTLRREPGTLSRAARGAAEHFPEQAAYAVPLAYRIRYVMEFSAREAMHLLELRSAPQGHPTYRRIAQEMHRQIGAVAGHRLIADSMVFVDYSEVELGRLEAEERAAVRRSGSPSSRAGARRAPTSCPVTATSSSLRRLTEGASRVPNRGASQSHPTAYGASVSCSGRLRGSCSGGPGRPSRKRRPRDSATRPEGCQTTEPTASEAHPARRSALSGLTSRDFLRSGASWTGSLPYSDRA